MSIKVQIPNICLNEQRYILDIMLGEFLGLSFSIDVADHPDIIISEEGSVEQLSLNADFFHLADKYWLKPRSMPDLPLQKWRPNKDSIYTLLVGEALPVIYGQPGLVKKAQHWHLNLDLFGSAFFMLSRYEEMITQDRDQHDRFPAVASVAYKANFLDRPIVNEYLEILWACLHSLWPDIKRKDRKAQNFITCDVDLPFNPAYYSFNKMIRVCGSQILKEYALFKAAGTFSKYLLSLTNIRPRDDYRENISWMMDVNEKAGNKVSFFFITQNTSELDTSENFNSEKMRALFKEIIDRGHEIGVHPGYETFNNPISFKQTVDELKRIFQEEGIEQAEFGGRQHFLRWDTACTPHLWEEHGMEYDSTLSFADKAGFRCGICYEFTMYDLVNRKPFNLKQRPLIVMECTVISPRYEGLGYSEQSLQRFNQCKRDTHKFNGVFTLLWHNSHFENKKDKEFYKKLIQ